MALIPIAEAIDSAITEPSSHLSVYTYLLDARQKIAWLSGFDLSLNFIRAAVLVLGCAATVALLKWAGVSRFLRRLLE
jgi:hypothetical protein